MEDDRGIRLDCVSCGTTVHLGPAPVADLTRAARGFFTAHPTCRTVIDLTEELVGWSHRTRTERVAAR